MLVPSALHGREAVVDRAIAQIDGGAGGVVLVGEGGIGKTRIAREIVNVAVARGYHAVATVGTQAAAAIPLGALSHLLPDLGTGGASALVAARRSLTEQAGDRPLLISVDDAHLLDDYSASLLLQLAMSTGSVVVATLRAGEPAPDAIVALWKDGLAERVEVGRLDEAAIRRLVVDVLGGPASQRLVRAVIEVADGNPLVARELCLAGREAQAIEVVNGTWTQTGDLHPSARLVELVSARLAGLSNTERHALDLVAHGEPLPVTIARRLGGADVLVSLERRGLVQLRDDGQRQELWLIHPVYADVLRSTAGPLLAAELKAALASATLSTGMRRRTDLLRVATWQLESGTATLELLRRAGLETYRAGDMVATARFAAAAWDREHTSETGLLLATALAYQARYDEADAIFSVAGEEASDEESRARIALVHAAILAAGLERTEEAMALLRDAERRAAQEPIRASLRGQQAHLHALAGRVAEALALAEPLLEEPRSGPVYVTGAMAAVIAWTAAGSYAAAVDVAEEALPEAERLWAAGATSVPPEMFRLEAGGARASLGDLSGGDEPIPGLVAGIVVNRPVAVLGALHAASVDLNRGRPRSAEAHIESVGPVREDLLAGPVHALLATCRALTGRMHESDVALAISEARSASGAILNPFLDEARAWNLVAGGRPEEARRGLDAAIERGARYGRHGLVLVLAHLLARLGGVEPAARHLEAIPDAVAGRLPDLRREHVRALVAGDPHRLEALGTAFAEIGADLLAAEAATQASAVLRRRGESRRANRMRLLARELADRCEGARTPGLVLEDGLEPLSRRELEIADLVAAGLTSAEVAERLFLSTRTVDNHLQHVYQKLGITSRAELRPALHRSGGPSVP